MCKVRIVNHSNNYNDFNNPTIETDIPSEMVPLFEKIFHELNSKRVNAVCPSISINKI